MSAAATVTGGALWRLFAGFGAGGFQLLFDRRGLVGDLKPLFEDRDRLFGTAAEAQGATEVEERVGVAEVFAAFRVGSDRFFEYGDRRFVFPRLDHRVALFVEGGPGFGAAFGSGRRFGFAGFGSFGGFGFFGSLARFRRFGGRRFVRCGRLGGRAACRRLLRGLRLPLLRLRRGGFAAALAVAPIAAAEEQGRADDQRHDDPEDCGDGTPAAAVGSGPGVGRRRFAERR